MSLSTDIQTLENRIAYETTPAEWRKALQNNIDNLREVEQSLRDLESGKPINSHLSIENAKKNIHSLKQCIKNIEDGLASGKIAADDNQLKRLTHDWTHIAGEPVEVEEISGAYYGFCSELGTLRLLKKYRHSGEKAKADYSENKGKFYFRLEK